MTTVTAGKAYCNCVALQRKLDPVGHAGHFDDAIVIETPLPWKHDLMQTAGALPQAMISLLGLWLEEYKAGRGYPHLPLVIATDPAYARPGFRRVLFYTRPMGLFSRFDKLEYLIPAEQLGDLVWALYQDRDALPRFEAHRVPNGDQVRDVLVCTHGAVDAACARFGYPLYQHLTSTYAGERLRIWRVSHFGGHVFAPTLMDMPTGHYWAYVEKEQAAQIIGRTGDVAALRGHYRGWAGLRDGFQQRAECELWQQHGWAWFGYPKSGETIEQDTRTADPRWAEVRLKWAAPAETSETITDMRVEISHTVETPHTTGSESTYAYPQYRVASPNPL